MNKPNAIPSKVVIRITEDQYRDLEKKARRLAVSKDTTALETSFILGQRSILELIRDGWVVDVPNT